MTGGKKSTDPGLSNAERKLRGREAKEAIADHEERLSGHANRERLREERLARESAAGQWSLPLQSCRTIGRSNAQYFLPGSRTRSEQQT
jgi:hypothetical protein